MALLVFCGEGDLEIIPDPMPKLGFPIDLRTVSRVRSIFLRDLVRSSCFLVLKLSVQMIKLFRIKRRTWMYVFHD